MVLPAEGYIMYLSFQVKSARCATKHNPQEVSYPTEMVRIAQLCTTLQSALYLLLIFAPTSCDNYYNTSHQLRQESNDPVCLFNLFGVKSSHLAARLIQKITKVT